MWKELPPPASSFLSAPVLNTPCKKASPRRKWTIIQKITGSGTVLTLSLWDGWAASVRTGVLWFYWGDTLPLKSCQSDEARRLGEGAPFPGLLLLSDPQGRGRGSFYYFRCRHVTQTGPIGKGADTLSHSKDCMSDWTFPNNPEMVVGFEWWKPL